MEDCKGFNDWFACLKCPDICTKACPIEKENALEELKKRICLIEGQHNQVKFKEI